jgi:hypothetical protein
VEKTKWPRERVFSVPDLGGGGGRGGGGGGGGGAAMREMGVKAGGNEREEMGMVAA